MYFLYFIIGLLASTIGSIAGLGGGVIIKPALDLFSHFDLPTIGVLSAVTVLSMSTVSLVKFSKNREITIDRVTSSIIAAGSILGGFAGKAIFNLIAISLNIPTTTAIIQSSLLAGILMLIYFYFKQKHNFKSFILKNKMIILIVGFSLGLLSSFLGIGGGPLNVAVLSLFFSMSTKNAGINSIFIIFFSQLAAITLIALTTGFGQYNLTMLFAMVPGGIIGGIIGSYIITKLANVQVEKVFSISILIIIFISLYNIVRIAFF